MIINLPNGKTLEVSVEVYLRMTDEDFEYLLSVNWGDEIVNPFQSSVLLFGEAPADEEDDEETLESNVDTLSDLDAEIFEE